MKIATFDAETNGLLDTVTKVWCICILDHKTEEIEAFGPEDIHDALKKLEEYDVLCGHNVIAFDFAVFRKLYNWHTKSRIIDTLLISRTQRPTRKKHPGCSDSPHSVAAWAARLGEKKVENEVWSEFTPNILYRCMEDVRIQHKIFHALAEEGTGEGWKPAHRLNSEVFQKLQLQSERGWKVDLTHLDFCLYMLNKWMSKIDGVLVDRLPFVVIPHFFNEKKRPTVKSPINKSGGLKAAYQELPFIVDGPFSFVTIRRVDVNKSDEVKNYLLSLGWKPTEWNYNNGKRTSPKLSFKDKFEGLTDKVGVLLTKRVQCKQRRGVIEGWKKAVREDGRISTPVSGSAATGRLRHSVVVNVPGNDTFFGKWMRKIFIASDGMVMIGCDSKGNQARQLCARMGDDEYTEAVINGDKDLGTDEHSVTQRKCGLPSRGVAKNLFYGTIFGAGDPKAGKIVGGDAAKGAELKAMLFQGLPKLLELRTRLEEEWLLTAVNVFDPIIKRVVKANGYITGLDGRPVLVPHKHEVLVYLLQSDEAIQMAYAYNWFWNQMEKRGWKHGEHWGMLIWYHDEFQFEVDPKYINVEEAAALAEESIEVAGIFYNIQCKHEGEAKIGYNWKDCH